MFEIEEEESLDLVAVDAEMIRTMVETQGEIISKLDFVINSMHCVTQYIILSNEIHKNLQCAWMNNIEKDKAAIKYMKHTDKMHGKIFKVLEAISDELRALRGEKK